MFMNMFLKTLKYTFKKCTSKYCNSLKYISNNCFNNLLSCFKEVTYFDVVTNMLKHI